MNPALLLPGTEVGPWRVQGLRGRGSYGVVYRVEKIGHVDTRPFALKLALHPLDPRFEREGELLSRLRHPHVPRLHDRGWWVLPGGMPYPYLVMEWIEGVPLYEWAAQHPLTSRHALRLLAQVARALEATHAVEGVHRDVKGDNVLIREDGSAVLMDFGSGNYDGARTLTHQPPLPGTPQYQSPESLRFQWQWRPPAKARYEARPLDDVYALGVTAYRLVTGRYPPPAVDVEETESGSRLIHPARVPPETWVSLCPELAGRIHQMLAPEPSVRGSAAEVAQALEHAERTAGLAADLLITPLRTQAPSPNTIRLVHVPASAGLPWLAAAVILALAIGAWRARHGSLEERSAEVAQEAREGGKEDAGTVGLGESVRSSQESVALPAPARAGIGLDLPKEPLPGQRGPPCAKPALEINGGCWVHWSDSKPPCGTQAYEWESRCYLPIYSPPRPTTSEQP